MTFSYSVKTELSSSGAESLFSSFPNSSSIKGREQHNIMNKSEMKEGEKLPREA